MQRTAKVNKEVQPEVINQVDLGPKRIRYQKIGGGSLRMPNRIIKPNQVFLAYPEEIPESFARWIKPLDPVPDKKGKIREVISSTYKIEPRGEDGHWFDVISAEGKIMNAKPLGRVRAEELLKDLS